LHDRTGRELASSGLETAILHFRGGRLPRPATRARSSGLPHSGAGSGCRTGRHSSCTGSIGSGRNCSLIDEVGGRKCGADFAPLPNPFHRHYPPPSRPGATQLHSLHRNQRTSAMAAVRGLPGCQTGSGRFGQAS